MAAELMDTQHIDAELDHALRHGPAKDIAIPPSPELLVRLQAIMDGPDPDPDDIAAVASADVALAASLLKTANGPLFARRSPAGTVREAIAVLGMKPSAAILTGFLVRYGIRVTSPLLERFWETSAHRATACAYMARQLYTVDVGLAHTFGLFCHVGIPIMMMGVKGYSGTLVEAWARQDRSFTATEDAAHQTNHAVVGALVSRAWLLPRTITLAVRLHHDFTVLHDRKIPDEVRTLVAMGLVSEHLVHSHMGLQPLIEWTQHGAACLDVLKTSTSELDYWIDQLHDQFLAGV